jgi:hypothetical protein
VRGSKLDGWRKTWMVGTNFMKNLFPQAGVAKPLHWGGLEPHTFTLRWPWATHLYIEVALSHKPLHWGGLEPHTHVSHFRIVVKNLSHSATCIVWYTIYKCLPKTISNKIIHFLIFFISTSQLSNNYKYLLIN